MFTVRQGEYLAFIHSYATKVGVSPSFEDIARHFDGVRHRRSAARR
jgi:SOS-response transcriptional repressor LexA